MLSKTSRVISSKARQPLGRRPEGKAISQCGPAKKDSSGEIKSNGAKARSSGGDKAKGAKARSSGGDKAPLCRKQR